MASNLSCLAGVALPMEGIDEGMACLSVCRHAIVLV